MLDIQATGAPLGATVRNLDLSAPLSAAEFSAIVRALGEHGVLRFPDQNLDARALRSFSQMFGRLQDGMPMAHDPDVPEVSILSNIVDNDGKNVGVPDAGQEWHTDMTYNALVGFVNVLFAVAVPFRDGKALGATEFTNTQLAYQQLPDDLKAELADATATHDLNKYWEYVRNEKGSKRAPLTEAQRKERPPVSHPVFLTHPITGRKAIYVNPSFTVAIDGMAPEKSDAVLDRLFEHILDERFRYTHRWQVNDLVVWDNLGTWHNAVADYGPDEHRLMKRCQVLADRVFDKDFQSALTAG